MPDKCYLTDFKCQFFAITPNVNKTARSPKGPGGFIYIQP
jgi:hypothetical protein